MPPAARISDLVKQDAPHCHAPIHPAAPVPTPVPHPGLPLPIIKGQPNVLIGGLPAARSTDMTAPCILPGCVPAGPGMISKGSSKVLIGGLPAARVGDMSSHASCVAPIPSPVGKVLPPGCPTVIIGGLIGLIIFLALYFKRKLHIRTEHYTQHATIYIEAAAGWLLTYFAMGLLLGRLVPFFDPLLTNIAVSAISFMFAVFWPIIRGVRIDAFLKDIGFVGNVVVESCIGLISYVSCLPILAAGYLVTMIAIFVAGPTLQEGGLSSPSGPGHPIVEWISEGSISTIALVFIMTCVCAPLLEETVFRGLMYRNLRDNTFRAGHFVSVTLSALVNGFIFAAIHPQGILFIPMLGALALSFSIVREWRGSLIAPMTMHAIHNGLVTSFLLFVMMD